MINKHHAFVNKLREFVYMVYYKTLDSDPYKFKINPTPIIEKAMKIDTNLAWGFCRIFESSAEGIKYINKYFNKYSQYFEVHCEDFYKSKKNFKILSFVLAEIASRKKKRTDGLEYELITLEKKDIVSFNEFRAYSEGFNFLASGGSWTLSDKMKIYQDLDVYKRRGEVFFDFINNFSKKKIESYMKPDKKLLIKSLLPLYSDILEKSGENNLNFSKFRAKWIDEFISKDLEGAEMHEIEHLKRKAHSYKSELIAILKEISDGPLPYLAFYGAGALDEKQPIDDLHRSASINLFKVFSKAMGASVEQTQKYLCKLNEDEVRMIAKEAYLKLN